MISNKYYEKYLKYKIKYLKLKGGSENDNNNFFLCYNTDKSLEILRKYDNFSNPELFESTQRLNASGGMSIVNILNYKNNTDSNNFKILYKTSAKYIKEHMFIDNNYFEYANGVCINYIKKFYPNFIYTYNLTQTSNEGIKTIVEKNKLKSILTVEELKKDLVIFDKKDPKEIGTKENLENACANQDKLSLSLEFLENSYNLEETINKSEFQEDIDYNIWCLLFQIYATLYALENIFSHNDLRDDNIMIKELPNRIKIQYKLKDGDFCIYTKYIPVFIDYGQSYVNAKSIGFDYSSEELLTSICYTSCNTQKLPKCWNKSGFKISIDDITKQKLSDDKYAKNRGRYNKSQDMGFLIYIQSFLKQSDNFIPLRRKYTIPIESQSGPKSVIRDYINNIFNEYIRHEWFDDEGIIDYSKEKLEQDLYVSGQKTKDDIIKQNIGSNKDVYYLLIDIYNVEGFNTKTFEITETMKINLNISEKEPWIFEKN